MHFGWKTIPIALLLLSCFCAGCATTHYRVSDSHTMDDARTRLILKTVPGFDMSQVWFATGAEYWTSDTCLRGRDIEAFTKPQLSSPGVWRGKKLYVSQPTLDSKAECADPDAFRYDPDSTIATVTFTDPDQLHPEEAWDGLEPGLFEVRDNVSDDELRKVASAIAEIHACLEKQAVCAYPITRSSRGWTDNVLAGGMDTKNLLTMAIEKPDENGESCFSMITETDTNEGAYGAEICYRNGKISNVVVGDEITE
ncbi:MAG TPA: hypothetical protein VGH91_11695 [Gammaproteobacteria bacterium]|jgi:hypothetical protein